ncbi:MAG: Crp/Fnr family transcriptional regulator [Burkholderiales bacterium]|nr:Crp/Fnr family transcriptional regulator [Burkholderiales bacterium]
MAQPSIHIGILRNVPLFSVLDEAQLRSLSTVMLRKSAPKNRTIIKAGDPTDSLYIIIAGRIKVQMSDVEGKEVILSVLGPGDFFGEMGLLDGAPRAASVVTLEQSEFVSVSKEDFNAVLKNNFELAMVIMRGLVKRLREADRKIESLALLDVYGRVARVLLEFSEDIGGRKVIKGKLPRQDIAKMIGASREMVSRVMKGLEIEGYIEVQPDGAIVLRERLAATL